MASPCPLPRPRGHACLRVCATVSVTVSMSASACPCLACEYGDRFIRPCLSVSASVPLPVVSVSVSVSFSFTFFVSAFVSVTVCPCQGFFRCLPACLPVSAPVRMSVSPSPLCLPARPPVFRTVCVCVCVRARARVVSVFPPATPAASPARRTGAQTHIRFRTTRAPKQTHPRTAARQAQWHTGTAMSATPWAPPPRVRVRACLRRRGGPLRRRVILARRRLSESRPAQVVRGLGPLALPPLRPGRPRLRALVSGGPRARVWFRCGWGWGGAGVGGG